VKIYFATFANHLIHVIAAESDHDAHLIASEIGRAADTICDCVGVSDTTPQDLLAEIQKGLSNVVRQ
jgi:hypothetical protein